MQHRKLRILPALLSAACLIPVSAAATEYDLTARSGHEQAFEVEVRLRVGGDLTVRSTRTPDAPDDAPATTLKMSADGKLAYEEAGLSTNRFARHYNRATASIQVGNSKKQPSLDEQQGLIVAELADGQPPVLSSPTGPLTREQLDLINVIGSSPLLDGLLPNKTLQEAETWQVGPEVMGPLLGMDEVSICEVSNVVDEGNASHVKFQIAGVIHGKVEGAETEFDVRGLALYSVADGCVTRLNLAVKEKRNVGPATPGFTGVAKVNIKRTPIDTPSRLTAEVLARADRVQLPTADLVIDSTDLGMQVVHDRDWYLASETRRSLSLRRISSGNLVAQATLTKVPSKKRANQPSLDQFESEVRQSLGESLAEVVSSQQWTSPTGCQCLGVVVRGKAQDLDIEQRHYLIMPDGEGHAIALAATLAVDDMVAMGNADRILADAVVLLTTDSKVANKLRAKRVE